MSLLLAITLIYVAFGLGKAGAYSWLDWGLVVILALFGVWTVVRGSYGLLALR